MMYIPLFCCLWKDTTCMFCERALFVFGLLFLACWCILLGYTYTALVLGWQNLLLLHIFCFFQMAIWYIIHVQIPFAQPLFTLVWGWAAGWIWIFSARVDPSAKQLLVMASQIPTSSAYKCFDLKSSVEIFRPFANSFLTEVGKNLVAKGRRTTGPDRSTGEIRINVVARFLPFQ